MADPTDPATAELVRAMHREMNGLTRHRSRATPMPSQMYAHTPAAQWFCTLTLRAALVRSLEPKQKRQRLNESQSSTSEESRRAEAADHSSKAGPARLQGSGSASRPLKRLQKQTSTAGAQDQPTRKQQGAAIPVLSYCQHS